VLSPKPTDDFYHAIPFNRGKTILCDANFALTRYDVASGMQRSLDEDKWENGVSLIALAPDGITAAAAYFTRPLQLYNIRSGKHLHTLQTIKDAEEEQEDWSWIAFSPDGNSLATSSGDYNLRLWNVAIGRLQKTWKLPNNPGEIVFAPDGSFIAVAGAGDKEDKDGSIWLVALDGKKPLRTLVGHKAPLNCLAIAPNGRTLASGSMDGTIHLWDISGGVTGKTARLIHRLKPDNGEINAVRFMPSGALVSATDRGQMQVWDTKTGRRRLTWQPLPGKANWVAWTPEGFYDATRSAASFLRWKQGEKWLTQLPQMKRPEVIEKAWGF
jgi:WD40 repeat protein